MPVDPVRGMEVGEDSQFKSKAEGKTIYFCCLHCKSSFDKSPGTFNV